MKRATLPLIAVVALAGCGSSSSSKSTSTSSRAPAPASAAPSGPVTIHMQNIQFNPSSQTVKSGQKVTWVNDDTVDHNVTAQSGESFHSSDFGKGASFSFTPKKTGDIKYVCTLHPGMEATLHVV